MRTEATVGLLRKLLTDRGHILPTSTHRDSKCIILNHGEYLVSLMCHDSQLMNLLHEPYEGAFDSLNGDDGDLSVDAHVFMLLGQRGDDFDIWVDTVKFIWFNHGVSEVLSFIRNTGLVGWSRWPTAKRHDYVDSLVLIAQKKLRESGSKFREMAHFFADPASSKDVPGEAPCIYARVPAEVLRKEIREEFDAGTNPRKRSKKTTSKGKKTLWH